MAKRVPVHLRFDVDAFTARMHRLREAAAKLGQQMTLQQATWEPHDWSDFD